MPSRVRRRRWGPRAERSRRPARVEGAAPEAGLCPGACGAGPARRRQRLAVVAGRERADRRPSLHVRTALRALRHPVRHLAGGRSRTRRHARRVSTPRPEPRRRHGGDGGDTPLEGNDRETRPMGDQVGTEQPFERVGPEGSSAVQQRAVPTRRRRGPRPRPPGDARRRVRPAPCLHGARTHRGVAGPRRLAPGRGGGARGVPPPARRTPGPAPRRRTRPGGVHIARIDAEGHRHAVAAVALGPGRGASVRLPSAVDRLALDTAALASLLEAIPQAALAVGAVVHPGDAVLHPPRRRRR